MLDSNARKLHLFFYFAHIERIFIFNRNLKRISLSVVDETGMSASFVPNMYEMIHELNLCQHFNVLELLIAYILVYQMASFISCGESKSLKHCECCIYSLLLHGLSDASMHTCSRRQVKLRWGLVLKLTNG